MNLQFSPKKMQNLILIGMPGSGKTTFGREVARELQKDFLDFDEFIISQTGRDAVEHLAEMGDDEFLDFEKNLAQKVAGENLIIAASGSVPLRDDGILHLKKNGPALWLDTDLEIIKKWVPARPDGHSRIVGADKLSFEEILNWRRKSYEKHADFKFEIQNEKAVDEIVAELLEFILREKVLDRK